MLRALAKQIAEHADARASQTGLVEECRVRLARSLSRSDDREQILRIETRHDVGQCGDVVHRTPHRPGALLRERSHHLAGARYQSAGRREPDDTVVSRRISNGYSRLAA